MNKIGVVIKGPTMTITLLLFSYGVGVTIVLTVMVLRSEYYRQLYHQVAWDQYSLERVKITFQQLNSIISTLYPLIDRFNKPVGRPPTDRRFQLRFVIWWKLFGPEGQQTAVDIFNQSPSLQQIIQAPPVQYTRSSLRRFLHLLGETGWQEIGVTLVQLLIEKDYLSLSRLTIDSFPVYSYLNPRKCYRSAPFKPKIAKSIFTRLNLSNVVELFPIQHGLSKSLSDKVLAWVHHYLWDIPSEASNHSVIFSKNGRHSVLGIRKGWKSVSTYRNFLKRVQSLPNRSQIENALLTEITRVLTTLNLIPSKSDFHSLDELRSVFYAPHRKNDPEISLNYCAAKDHHFFGRGGLIVTSPDLEVPVLVGLTSKYKQSESQIQIFLRKLFQHYNHKLRGISMIGDSEFGTPLIKRMLAHACQVNPSIDNYGNSSIRYHYTSSERSDLKTNERTIGRLTTQHKLERPKVYGNNSVAIHLQLATLSDILIFWYNILSKNKAHPHSFARIGRKKF